MFDQSAWDLSAWGVRDVQRLNILLARLVIGDASPTLRNLLSVAESHVTGGASLEQVREAREEVWALLTGLTCGAEPTESALMHLVLTCLEPDVGGVFSARIADQARRAVLAGAPESLVLGCFGEVGLTR